MEFIIRHKTIISFISFTLFCLISLTAHTSSTINSIEGLLHLFVVPFQQGYEALQSGVRRFWVGFTELGELRDELQRTRQKLMKYEQIADELTELKKENERLRHQLQMASRLEYESIPARVISRDPDNWYRTIILDRGSADGVKNNMPVVAYSGAEKAVIGKIIDVRSRVSRVIPIIAPEMKLGVMLQSSRYPGLLHGISSNSILCVMDYVSKSALVKFGDQVITSGQGGIFPQGLSVGKVLRSEIMEASAYQRVIVIPTVDYEKLEDVFILKKEPDAEFLELLKSAGN
ncbi:MAG: rod shape-determining protein MreC [Spirochaetes bacterium]|nr:rod shape-determining protein MreC [Spirochaetota bacterium]